MPNGEYHLAPAAQTGWHAAVARPARSPSADQVVAFLERHDLETPKRRKAIRKVLPCLLSRHPYAPCQNGDPMPVVELEQFELGDPVGYLTRMTAAVHGQDEAAVVLAACKALAAWSAGESGCLERMFVMATSAEYVARFAPPEPHERDARCCANISSLRDYLQHYSARLANGKRKQINYTLREGKVVFDKIHEWLGTAAGIAHLEACGLAGKDVTVDHVVARRLGGPFHIGNAHLMEKSANSHFHERFDKEKERFVGARQVAISLQLMQWMKSRCDWEHSGELDE